MANAHHPHLLTREWFERSRLRASLSRHTVAWSVVAFLSIVAVLLVLFEWLQILPEQVTMSTSTPNSSASPVQARGQTSQNNLSEPFPEPKKAARNAYLPNQF